MKKPSSDIAFTPRVKEIQSRKGSRGMYENMQMRTEIDTNIGNFIADQCSVFLGSVSSDNAPYIQHRGGPPEFLKILDPNTIAFVDFIGNKQFVSQGNFQDNPKAFLFLIDYRTKTRIKIWGSVSVVENDDKLTKKLMPEDYRAIPEQVMIFKVTTLDVNCPQHIPRRYEAEDVENAIREKDDYIEQLKTELALLKQKKNPN